MHVESILTVKGNEVISTTVNETMRGAAAMMIENQIGALLVRDEEGFVQGVLSERDILRGVSERGAGCMDASVADFMTRDVIYCKPEDDIDTLMSVMTENRVRHLPVMRHNHLLGIISIGDVVKFRIEEIESEAAAMRQYIASA